MNVCRMVTIALPCTRFRARERVLPSALARGQGGDGHLRFSSMLFRSRYLRFHRPRRPGMRTRHAPTTCPPRGPSFTCPPLTPPHIAVSCSVLATITTTKITISLRQHFRKCPAEILALRPKNYIFIIGDRSIFYTCPYRRDFMGIYRNITVGTSLL